jgi:hypothetical protein
MLSSWIFAAGSVALVSAVSLLGAVTPSST